MRPGKVRQNISGTFQSKQGPEIFCRNRHDISTPKKQGVPALEYIQQGLPGERFYSASAALP